MTIIYGSSKSIKRQPNVARQIAKLERQAKRAGQRGQYELAEQLASQISTLESTDARRA